jgi:hypothetical protein
MGQTTTCLITSRLRPGSLSATRSEDDLIIRHRVRVVVDRLDAARAEWLAHEPPIAPKPAAREEQGVGLQIAAERTVLASPEVHRFIPRENDVPLALLRQPV